MDLILITSIYPFEKGEEFLETEINYLARKFELITIIPLKVKSKSTQTRSLPENVAVHDIKLRNSNLLVKIINNIKFLRYLKYGFEEEKSVSFSHLRKLFYVVNHASILNNHINRIAKNNSNSSFTIYSYWFTSMLLGFFLKAKLGKSVTRLHGGDLYEDRNYIPFRRFLYREIDHLCPISSNGEAYLKSNYDLLAEKIKLNRLGVEDFGLVRPSPNQYFTILSCSYLVEVKRINLIIEALSKFDENSKVQWIHIGTGPLSDELSKKAEKILNCHYDFLGYIPNKDLAKVYKEYKPNLLLNCSASEGIPVSMMEAISFGVPILATDVGGVSEIVNDQTGFLINADVNANEIHEKLIQIIENKLADKKRKSAKDFYLSNFNAKKNYNDFIDNILID